MQAIVTGKRMSGSDFDIHTHIGSSLVSILMGLIGGLIQIYKFGC